MEIPIHVVGEPKSDAMTVTELNTMSIKAKATNIPEYLEISVEGADTGFHVIAKDLVLPEGSTLFADEDALVSNVVHAPTAEEVEAELEEAEARPASSATTPRASQVRLRRADLTRRDRRAGP